MGREIATTSFEVATLCLLLDPTIAPGAGAFSGRNGGLWPRTSSRFVSSELRRSSWPQPNVGEPAATLGKPRSQCSSTSKRLWPPAVNVAARDCHNLFEVVTHSAFLDPP